MTYDASVSHNPKPKLALQLGGPFDLVSRVSQVSRGY